MGLARVLIIEELGRVARHAHAAEASNGAQVAFCSASRTANPSAFFSARISQASYAGGGRPSEGSSSISGVGFDNRSPAFAARHPKGGRPAVWRARPGPGNRHRSGRMRTVNSPCGLEMPPTLRLSRTERSGKTLLNHARDGLVSWVKTVEIPGGSATPCDRLRPRDHKAQLLAGARRGQLAVGLAVLDQRAAAHEIASTGFPAFLGRDVSLPAWQGAG
jgi:hypothetical protein